MKILITTSTFPRWKKDPIPGFIFNFARFLKNKLCSVSIITPHIKKAKFTENIDGLSVIRYPYFFPLKWQKLCYGQGIVNNIRDFPLLLVQIPFLLTAQMLCIMTLLIKKKYTLINAHWILPQGIVAIVIKLFFNIPVVLSVHGSDIHYRHTGVIKALSRYVLTKADKICCVNRYIKKVIIDKHNITESKINVIPMGVDCKLFSPEKMNSKLKRQYKANPLIIFVGRFSPSKGIHYLIDAMPDILGSFPDAKLLLAGYGIKEKDLRKQTCDIQLEKEIVFLGKTNPQEVPELLASADLFIGPSFVTEKGESEGLPVSFMEAMACGCPVITTDLPGNYDLIENGETGIIIPQKNAKAISNAALKLLKDPEFRKKVSTNGRKKIAENFSWQKIAADHHKVFSEIINVKT